MSLPTDVVIVAPTARDCALAWEAIGAGDAVAAVSEQQLDDLVTVLDAVDRGYVVVAREVLDRAAALRPLSTRQREVLEAVTAGMRNGEIAASQHLSLPTVKREIAALRHALGAGTRRALVAAGIRMGFGQEGAAAPR